jgi:ATP-dependent Clp protease ATP-binding subunit ClpA
MKDQYVTEEHLFLALIEYSDSKTKDILSAFGITYQNILNIVENMR